MSFIEEIGVIGGGTMGQGIAQMALLKGYRVNIIEVNPKTSEKAKTNIESGFQKLAKKRKLFGFTPEEILSNLHLFSDLESGVKKCDLVIEAVNENLSLKKEIFAQCGKFTPDHCIIATNTSSMNISEIASSSSCADRCIGIHFFNPVPLMRLVEIIPGNQTSQETIRKATIWAKNLPCLSGKRFTPLVLKDRPGFIANRINAPVSIYLNWVIDYAKAHNISWEELSADVYSPFIPMDPIVLLDYVGIDIAFATQNYYSEVLSPDFSPGVVIGSLIKQNKLGMKSGQGFYDWSRGKPILDLSTKANLLDQEIMAAIQANEGCRLLEEGVVKNWTVIDRSIEAGMNSSGPMFFASQQYQKWTQLLKELAEKINRPYLKPCEMFASGEFLKYRV